MSYPKPWKSYDAQLDQLMARGMIVTDRTRALDHLKRIGYYRLSGYWFAFRERSAPVCRLDAQGRKPTKVREERIALDRFREGATFQNAVDLYVFDKQLRRLVMDALERIEIALRVDVSHTLGSLDPFAYLKPDLLHDEFSIKLDKDTGVTRHHEWLTKHAQLIGRSREEFVRHNRSHYGLPLAIWVACEVWDFGTLSTLFQGMRETEQDAIARQYGLSSGRIFATWLRSLNYLRNVCAHHSRLWNRNIVDQPKLPSAAEQGWVASLEVNAHARARCFLLLKITRHLLNAVHPRSTWADRMKAHLLAFPNLSHLGLNVAGMGAPDGWDLHW
ncbi:Abi family protein [Roseateles terrae]|uniref:Abortive infection bacteriophage resistance protein n=1 Tax=Roseateles terrae TaxID=431060 RepID=A0ABR6GSY1_9BURK|nr:Abi family protein [Roseateles terrae]MBB3195201.1 abortive infection bacteriophage resistance protein [Roseateles terrae]OWQ87218.1 abortive phage resistance protein [Roseateles terrae]